MASLEALPIETIEKIFLYCLTTSSFEFPNHVCWTCNNAINALSVFKSFQQMGVAYLPRIYINVCDYLPNPLKNSELVVNIQRLIRNFGSASSIVMELKRTVQSRFWNTAWLVLLSENYGWYIIENIFWKKKNSVFVSASVETGFIFNIALGFM